MMKKSQGKERERKKKREGVGGADGMRVYIFHSSPPGHGSISTIVFTVVELFKPAKRNPSLSLCLSSLLFIVHWSIIQLSRVDDRCKNDILASCALEREGEQVSLLLITPAQAKKNLFIVSAISKKEENGSGLHLIGAPSCPLKIYLWNPSKSLGQGR